MKRLIEWLYNKYCCNHNWKFKYAQEVQLMNTMEQKIITGEGYRSYGSREIYVCSKCLKTKKITL